jgi:RNA polymerase sigma factor (sigma-70 family)
MSSTSTNFESAMDNSQDQLATFLDIAQKHRARLLFLAWRITSRREEAEDIVQEALLKAFRALPRFRGDSRMDTWLHTIVRHAALESLGNRRAESNGRSNRSTPETMIRPGKIFPILTGPLKQVASAENWSNCCVLR